jgi:hypothetical protein
MWKEELDESEDVIRGEEGHRGAMLCCIRAYALTVYS